jgi:hypothetical protein
MTFDVPPSLHDLAELQQGVVARSQLLSAGLTPQLIKCRIDRGRWQRLHNGVDATFSGTAGRQATLWAAILRAGPGAVLSYQTAAELDGLIDKPSSAIHVTIPRSRRVAPIRGVRIHVKLDAERARHPARLPPRTRLGETVLDLADICGNVVDAVDWVTRALGRRLTTQDLLRQALNQRCRHCWRLDLAAVLSPDHAGIHSALEYRYFRSVEQPHALPCSTRQVRLVRGARGAYLDVYYEEFGLVVEFDGRIAHPGDSRWLDIWRDNTSAAEGRVTIRYGYRDLTSGPCVVAAQVIQVLRRRGWSQPARRCSPTCPVSSESQPMSLLSAHGQRSCPLG